MRSKSNGTGRPIHGLTLNAQMISKSALRLVDGCAFVAMLPYGSIYRRNTLLPIIFIVEQDDVLERQIAIERWFRVKLREAQYVQVAVSAWLLTYASFISEVTNSLTLTHFRGHQGAILFTSIISCLSWSNLSNTNWSGPAFWYAGIILALISIVLGAQQTMVLPDMQDDIDSINIRNRLMAANTPQPRPSRIMLFVWQSPLMCLTYSIICFLAGLSSVVISPLVRQPSWNDEAKVWFSPEGNRMESR